ncbi:Protein Skeletor, isoforms B/C [Orchesella cincta]|uniref:Protein Skeletor, isoforms B/C n=1 Tax=Orchesella cincta TaxID=48709 RepID=A0A1D2NGQ7_ORCCI|nr:Protein Skeletor, isoforms B/C [Orchesella cincta]
MEKVQRLGSMDSCAGSKGVYTSDSNFVTLPYPDDSCDRLKPGKRYTDEDVTLILPMSINLFETIGIFCYQYCHNFGHIRIPNDLNVPAAPSSLLAVGNCTKPNYGACKLGDTRNGQLEPDCTAGAGNMLPNLLMTICGIYFIRLIVTSQSN